MHYLQVSTLLTLQITKQMHGGRESKEPCTLCLVSGGVTQLLGAWKKHLLVTADPSAPLLSWFK